MFIAGVSGEPSVQTTTLMECLVRGMIHQVLETADTLAQGRKEKKFNTKDIILQFGRNEDRLTRIREFIRLRNLRKTAERSDKEAGGEVDAAELAANDNDDDSDGASGLSTDGTKKRKADALDAAVDVPTEHLPWSTVNMFPYAAQLAYSSTLSPPETEDTPVMAKPTTSTARIARLKKEDERTKKMTQEEYSRWTEARNSSFTKHKKEFRQWCRLGKLADSTSKSSEEVLAVLNMLACEWVIKITEKALAIKQNEMRTSKSVRDTGATNGSATRPSMFSDSTAATVPMVEPSHVRAAYQALQAAPRRYNLGPRTARPEKKIRLVCGFRLHPNFG
ncbi:hypothetical protein QBC47DRAFT_443206 [Echria macrotheca]|uniref:Uncharacterized protein n=1 Tax=Echria macrotheca TaxID=438768 RepID=A0AAJ0BEE2_9PEZI|nr:hypothetical protein QBC47DRAFT_443206 [Echria macrotheca]